MKPDNCSHGKTKARVRWKQPNVYKVKQRQRPDGTNHVVKAILDGPK